MRLMTLFCISLPLFFSAAFTPVHASFFGDQSHVSADLFVVENSTESGLLVSVHITMEPGWHVYWKNPGEAGMPVEIQWKLPEGFRAFPLEFPAPERFDSGGVTGYGYRDEVVLFSRIVPDTNPEDLSVSSVYFPLEAELSWLSCKEVCVPGSATLTLKGEKASPGQLDLAAGFRDRLPVAIETGGEAFGVDSIALGEKDQKRYIEVIFSGRSAGSLKDFFPLSPEKGLELSAITTKGRSVIIPLSGEEVPETIRGVAVTGMGAYVFDADTAAIPEKNGVSSAFGSLPLMLVFAFFGGILLNIMPCVLPVLGLKVFSLIGTDPSEHGRNTGRFLSLVFASGVLFSFWVLAGFVWGLQEMGASVGWGFQFQSPAFVLFIAAVVFGFSLNLFGLFEFATPVVSGEIDKVASHHDALGAFVSGVLATTLATPCTAPFLGTALGFAFAQPSWVVFLFFTVVAAGMAFPYVILAWNPAWLRFLPKPGHWMYVFKQLMGFVLVGVVIWLASILNTQAGGSGILRLFVLLLAVAFILWILGNLAGHGAPFKRQLLMWVAGLALLGAAYVFLIPEAKTAGRDDVLSGVTEEFSGSVDKNGVFWQDFSPALLDSLMQEKKTVFLEFTADWCLTCKVLEASVLSNQSVGDVLRQPDVAAVRADWTTRDDAITSMLQRFGRSGVPLFVIIPKGDLEKARVLPEIVTVEMLLSGLKEARS